MQVSVLIRKSIFRLQDIYELDISQIAAGKIGRKQSAARLSAQVKSKQG